MSEEPPPIFVEGSKIFQLPESDGFKVPEFQDCEIEMVLRKVHEQIYHQRRVDEVTNSTQLRKPMLMEFGNAGYAIVMAYRERRMLESYASQDCAIYEVDVNQVGEVMGFGVSLFPLDENNRPEGEPPYVQFTLTKDRFKHQGLATRRLIILNEANKMLTNNYLASGRFASHDEGAKKAWENLVAKGYAVQEDDGGYRFIK